MRERSKYKGGAKDFQAKDFQAKDFPLVNMLISIELLYN